MDSSSSLVDAAGCACSEGTQEEAARAYDRAAIEYRGPNAVTNFHISCYGQLKDQKKPQAQQLPTRRQLEQVQEFRQIQQQQMQLQLPFPKPQPLRAGAGIPDQHDVDVPPPATTRGVLPAMPEPHDDDVDDLGAAVADTGGDHPWSIPLTIGPAEMEPYPTPVATLAEYNCLDGLVDQETVFEDDIECFFQNPAAGTRDGGKEGSAGGCSGHAAASADASYTDHQGAVHSGETGPGAGERDLFPTAPSMASGTTPNSCSLSISVCLQS